MLRNDLPPLKFHPIEIKKMWGSEVWMLSGYEGRESVVASGPFAGRTLSELFGRNFPLLVKILDTHERLSLQVHPNEQTCKITGGAPKTEMWYVLTAAPGASLLAGLKAGVGRDDLERAFKRDTIEKVVARVPAKTHETFFIPGGLVHSIGSGYKVLEVQQTSDTTFRFYDWNRRDPLTGKCRQLHPEESFAAIDYTLPQPKVIARVQHQANSAKTVVDSPVFRFSSMRIDRPMEFDATQAFSAVYVEKGTVHVRNKIGEEVIHAGELVLIGGNHSYFIPEGRSDILIVGLKEVKAVKTTKVKRLSAPKAVSDFTRVEMPLRIDLAGGWSDTPPICNEVGGAVLNAAVTLDGINPVVAEVKKLEQPKVVVESVDLGRKGVITDRKDIYGVQDPHDWCALVKSALQVSGYEFREGGLHIRISANVPKGSGMGTSSILGAALLTALQKVRGRSESWETVAELTLKLEQAMGTGGGWQDQMGALVPGVKLVTTRPGAKQHIAVKRLSPAAEKAFARYLKDRGVLFFTGQKRMARNVLKGVLNFYRRNPEGIADAIVKALKSDAATCYNALAKKNYSAFAAGVNAYWLNKKALDPGSTNPEVESIIARIAPWTDAVTLCGAGGGGFLFAIARSRAARVKMESVLANAGNGGRCYRFSVKG